MFFFDFIAVLRYMYCIYAQNYYIYYKFSGYILFRFQGNNTDEEVAKIFLGQYNARYSFLANAYVKADWTYNTNLTDENGEAAVILNNK